MSKAVLSQLLCNVAHLDEVIRSKVLDETSAGRAIRALDALADPTLSVDRSTPAWGALQMYLLHLTGRYSEANRVLDNMIGLNISEQLTLDNCPSEIEIMARWEPSAEGISILCATYNHARFIDMALASFFSQESTHPFEVIVRDDASNDGTSDLLRKWEARYPNLLKVHKLPENTYRQGLCSLLGIYQLGQYPLIALCEGDDFWLDKNKIQIQADLLQKHTSWSAITHNHFELNESTGKLKPGRPVSNRYLIPKIDLIQVNTVLWIHTLMIRRSGFLLPNYKVSDGILGDQVLTAMLAIKGSVYYLGEFYGSVARRNLFSTYTPLNESAKQVRRINTRRYLASIMEKLGENQAANRMLRWCKIAEQQMQEH